MTKQTENQPLTKTGLISHVADAVGLPRKKIDEILSVIADVIGSHLKKGLTFSFIGLLKFYTIEKEATKEREMRNPFTGKMTSLPAKPAHKVVRVKPLKKLKEMVD